MALDLGHAVPARRLTHATHAARGAALDRLRQDIDPAQPATGPMTLRDVADIWHGHYDTGEADGEYHAFRLIGGPLITAGTPAGLESAIRADYARWASPAALEAR